MFHAEWFLFIGSKGLCGADCVFDLLSSSENFMDQERIKSFYLSTVKVTPSKSIIVILHKCGDFDTTNSLDFVEEGLPYALLRLCCQFAVAQGHMDARLKGWVEGLNAVGG